MLENHDNPRSVCRFGIDTKKYHYEAATFLAAVTFMGWGTPFIYQGEEIGMTNTAFRSIDDLKDPVSHFVYDMLTEKYHFPKAAAFRLICRGARDHARTPMQWDGTVNAGFNSGAETWQCVNPEYRVINAEADMASERSIYRFYQRLLAMRQSEDAALHGETVEYDPDDRNIIAYSRTHNGKRLLVIGNFSARPHTYTLPRDFELRDLSVALSNYSGQVIGRKMRLRPYEAIVFRETRVK